MNGKCFTWYPNGQLKEDMEYQQNKCIGKICYFSNGNTEMIEYYDDNGRAKSVKKWYETGQLNFEKDEHGATYSYSETGAVRMKSILTGDINKGGHVIILEFSDEGKIQKESKRYYVDGLLHGYEKSFYDTGEIKREIDYTNGHNNKIIKTYKKSGEVTIK